MSNREGPKPRQERGASTSSSADELRPVTALFADVVGSTSLGEHLSLPEVKAVIGECVSRMTEVVEAFGGRVTAFMGDGIAAFFGLEVTREDDVERGARAALEIRDVVTRYAVEVVEAWGVTDFDVRVGVNSGRAAIGRVGGSDPQLLALGDTVNVAARLQSAASPGTIVIGGAVARRLGERFVLRSLGGLQVRGRDEPVEAFELKGEGSSNPRTQDRPFVGRAGELAVFDSMLHDLEAGRGQLCVLLGDAGIGKTRMLAEMRRRTPSDVLWLGGSCDAIDSRLPYEPFVQAFRSWLGSEERSADIETRVKLASKVRALLGTNCEDQLVYLSRLLGVEIDRKLARRLDGLPPDLLTGGLIRAYRDWLVAVAHVSPLVLALDNFGLACSSTTDMGTALFEAVQHAPILMVVTMRPDVTEASRRLRITALDELAHRWKDVSITPLDRVESEMLVSELDRDEALDDRLRSVVVNRAEGNPLYIEELFAAIAAGPTVSRSEQELPAGLETLLLSRIDSLRPDARMVLQAAAVLGRRFPYEVLASMDVGGSLDFDEAFRTLLRTDVIREHSRQPRGFVFRHGLIREAALSTLTPGRSRELNRSAANALREWEGFDEERHAEPLARHYLACGENTEAVVCLENLADRLATVYRYDEASEILGRCLTEVRRGSQGGSLRRICLKQADVLAVRGHLDSAIELIDEAAATATATESLQLMVTKARLLSDGGRFNEADELIEECVSLSDTSSVVHAEALVLRGRMALHRQNIRRASVSIEKLGDMEALPEAVQYEGSLLITALLALKGDLHGAERWASRAVEAADRSGRVISQLRARKYAALVRGLLGYLDESRRAFSDLLSRQRDIGFITGQLETSLNVLWVLHMTGGLEEGVRVGEEALRLDPGPMWAALLSANLADIKLESGSFSDAERLAQLTLQENHDRGGWPRISAHIVVATCAARRDDWSASNRQLEAAWEEAATPGHEREQAMVQAAMAESACAQGDVPRALQHAEIARALVVPGMEVPLTLIVERVYGQMLAMSADPGAEVVLTNVLEGVRKAGMRLEESRVLVALGCLDSEKAAPLFEEARQILVECGGGLGLLQLRDAERRTFAPSGGARV